MYPLPTIGIFLLQDDHSVDGLRRLHLPSASRVAFPVMSVYSDDLLPGFIVSCGVYVEHEWRLASVPGDWTSVE